MEKEDKVRRGKEECFIKSRRSSGYYVRLDGTGITDPASCEKLRLLQTANHYLIERMQGEKAVCGTQFLPGPIEAGGSLLMMDEKSYHSGYCG